MDIRALIDELDKLGEVSDDQATAALDRLDTLERQKATASQVARYGALGGVAGAGVGAIRNAISGTKNNWRGAIGNAVGGAITAGAVPVIQKHLDRKAEEGTLKDYLKENDQEKSAGVMRTPRKLPVLVPPVKVTPATAPPSPALGQISNTASLKPKTPGSSVSPPTANKATTAPKAEAPAFKAPPMQQAQPDQTEAPGLMDHVGTIMTGLSALSSLRPAPAAPVQPTAPITNTVSDNIKYAFSTNEASGSMNPGYNSTASRQQGGFMPRADRGGSPVSGEGFSPTRGGFMLASGVQGPVGFYKKQAEAKKLKEKDSETLETYIPYGPGDFKRAKLAGAAASVLEAVKNRPELALAAAGGAYGAATAPEGHRGEGAIGGAGTGLTVGGLGAGLMGKKLASTAWKRQLASGAITAPELAKKLVPGLGNIVHEVPPLHKEVAHAALGIPWSAAGSTHGTTKMPADLQGRLAEPGVAMNLLHNQLREPSPRGITLGEEAAKGHGSPMTFATRFAHRDAHAASKRPYNSWDNKGAFQEAVQKMKERSGDKLAFKLQGHTNHQGLGIAIENRKGSVRKGVDKDGKPWRTEMKHPYGYIKGSKGADGEEVDCYVGPVKDAPNAIVVHQHKSDGKGYDEDKVMLGFGSKEEAREAYLKHYNDPKFLGPMKSVPIERLKELVESGKKLIKISGLLQGARTFSKPDAKGGSGRSINQISNPFGYGRAGAVAGTLKRGNI